VRARVSWAVLVGVLLALAFSSGSAILYKLLFGLLAIPLVGFVGSVFAARRLAGEVRAMSPYLQVGETLEEQITLRNLHWFPKLLLEAEHQTRPFGTNGRVLTLWPYKSSTWTVQQHCERRGIYEFGELKVTSRDPLGLFNRTLWVGEPQTALIYPATVDLPGFFVPSGHGWTEGLVRGKTSTPSAVASTVREFVPGDNVSHIHWRATARFAKLMVKEFEHEPSGPVDAVWVLLDLDSRMQAGEGVESTTEYAVTIAASVAKRFLDNGRSVGLVMVGSEEQMISPDTGLAQVGRVLQALALIEPGDVGNVMDAAVTISAEVGPGASVVIVSSASIEDVARAASVITNARASVVPVIVEAASFEGREVPRDASYRLPGTSTEAFVVHRGDEIQLQLDQRVRGGDIAAPRVGEVWW
jgi:uncharacterized protein (DUF58 family)